MGKKDKEIKRQKKAKKANKANKTDKKKDMAVLKDISIEEYDLHAGKLQLLSNTHLKIAHGKKYGLIGKNGSGKTTLMNAIATRDIDIPEQIDVFIVDQELSFDKNQSVINAVLSANKKRLELLAEQQRLENLMADDEEDDVMERYTELCENIDSMGFDRDAIIVSKLLLGLGFDEVDQQREVASFSGGWKMRISLARALYIKPTLLLLDEPTNHLDLETTIWLTEYLTNHWDKTLVIVSHDREFIDEVCTDIIHLYDRKLAYHKGNYSMFISMFDQNKRTIEHAWTVYRKELKEFQKEHNNKKDIDAFIKKNEVPQPMKHKTTNMKFPEVMPLVGNVIGIYDVSFGYDELLFEKISHGIDMNTIITIVGKNGVGKSTFLKLLAKELNPISGSVDHNPKLRLGYYNQHSSDILPLEKTSVQYLMELDDIKEEEARKYLGTFGIEGINHKQAIKFLSGGQKARVSLIGVILSKPHVMLLDEPTNHLDIDTIDALIKGINDYNGAVIMVTHDVNLITCTNSVLWKLSDKTLTDTKYDRYAQEIINAIDDIE
jgi:ATP-binding cassette, subfamily F, member 1